MAFWRHFCLFESMIRKISRQINLTSLSNQVKLRVLWLDLAWLKSKSLWLSSTRLDWSQASKCHGLVCTLFWLIIKIDNFCQLFKFSSYFFQIYPSLIWPLLLMIWIIIFATKIWFSNNRTKPFLIDNNKKIYWNFANS